MPKDVFDAMRETEFDFMLHRLEQEVNKFTSIQADKRNTYRKKVREEKKAGTTAGAALSSTPARQDVAMEDADGERAAKRARRESGDVGEATEEEEVEGDETVDVEDEEVEDDEIEEEVVEEGLTEDPLEEKEDKEEDDDMEDGNETD
jgi:DNA polymerase epsilon subunit 3